MAEVHIIGSILGASKFPSQNLTLKYKFISGEDWKLLEGRETGQTHVDIPLDCTNTIWSHLIGINLNLIVDLHYNTKSLNGWPFIQCEVYHQDIYGRHELYGYAFANIPSSPGTHSLEAIAWRPVAYFLGIHPQLQSPELTFKSNNRFKLTTESMGMIHLELTVLLRGSFDDSGISL